MSQTLRLYVELCLTSLHDLPMFNFPKLIFVQKCVSRMVCVMRSIKGSK